VTQVNWQCDFQPVQVCCDKPSL